MPVMPTVSDIKTYLGLTGSQDDALLAQCLADAISKAERDTGRTFAAASNITTRYSTDGQASIVVHDRPYADPSRVVSLQGATTTEGSGVWFLPDRRDQNISATVQLRHYDTSVPDWYKADPGWFDKNLDHARYATGAPNDLVITGDIGHAFPSQDVVSNIIRLGAWLYWRAKSGASGFIQSPTGEEVDLSQEPAGYLEFVRNWRIRTAVIAP
jgi:hypothetical protein